jgi:hypothetical protein
MAPTTRPRWRRQADVGIAMNAGTQAAREEYCSLGIRCLKGSV